jgi:hypothetical protein
MFEEWRLRFPERHRPERGAPETELLMDAWIAGFAKHNEITCALRSRPVEQQSCTWTYDPDGYWKTECGDHFCITEGSPAENRMSYCHCCSRRIVTDTEAGVIDSDARTEPEGTK